MSKSPPPVNSSLSAPTAVVPTRVNPVVEWSRNMSVAVTEAVSATDRPPAVLDSVTFLPLTLDVLTTATPEPPAVELPWSTTAPAAALVLTEDTVDVANSNTPDPPSALPPTPVTLTAPPTTLAAVLLTAPLESTTPMLLPLPPAAAPPVPRRLTSPPPALVTREPT